MTIIIIISIMKKKSFLNLELTPCVQLLVTIHFFSWLYEKKPIKVKKNTKHLQLNIFQINWFCKILLTHANFGFSIHTC